MKKRDKIGRNAKKEKKLPILTYCQMAMSGHRTTFTIAIQTHSSFELRSPHKNILEVTRKSKSYKSKSKLAPDCGFRLYYSHESSRPCTVSMTSLLVENAKFVPKAEGDDGRLVHHLPVSWNAFLSKKSWWNVSTTFETMMVTKPVSHQLYQPGRSVVPKLTAQRNE